MSRIASAAAIHNRLLETRPDLAATLYGEYVYRRMERDASLGNNRLLKRVVIFSRETGGFTCNTSGSYPNRAVAAGDAVMTPLQIEALDEMERLAASPEFHLDMSIAEGDIQFLNNRVLLHGRTGYEDWPEIPRRRHLLRLWLICQPLLLFLQTKQDFGLSERQTRTSLFIGLVPMLQYQKKSDPTWLTVRGLMRQIPIRCSLMETPTPK